MLNTILSKPPDAFLKQETEAYISAPKSEPMFDEIDRMFDYHSPTPYSKPKLEAVREAARYFARVIVLNVPPGLQRGVAIQLLKMLIMSAIAAEGHKL